jgi:hypothetical protein
MPQKKRAYVAAAGPLAVGAVLLAALLRRHLAIIDVEEPITVTA